MITKSLSDLLKLHFDMSYFEPGFHKLKVQGLESHVSTEVHTVWAMQVSCGVSIQDLKISHFVVAGVISEDVYLGLLLVLLDDSGDGKAKSISEDVIFPIDLTPLREKFLPKLKCIDVIHAPVIRSYDAMRYGFTLNIMTSVGTAEIDLLSSEVGKFPHLDDVWYDFMDIVDYLVEKEQNKLILEVIAKFRTREEG
jgi:hypothetical protein